MNAIQASFCIQFLQQNNQIWMIFCFYFIAIIALLDQLQKWISTYLFWVYFLYCNMQEQ